MCLQNVTNSTCLVSVTNTLCPASAKGCITKSFECCGLSSKSNDLNESSKYHELVLSRHRQGPQNGGTECWEADESCIYDTSRCVVIWRDIIMAMSYLIGTNWLDPAIAKGWKAASLSAVSSRKRERKKVTKTRTHTHTHAHTHTGLKLEVHLTVFLEEP